MIEVVYPLLVVIGCAAVALVVSLLTRPEPSRDDIALPRHAAADPGSSVDQRIALADWHLEHGETFLDYLDLNDAFFGVAAMPTGREPSSIAAAFEHAAGAHPVVAMRAELGAMHAAAWAMRDAARRGDDDVVARHRRVYLDYRSSWLDRLAQFPADGRRVADIRDRVIPQAS